MHARARTAVASRTRRPVVVQPDHKAFFEPVLFNFLKLCVDGHKRVQEAGISALATFEEEACYDLVPYLTPLCETLIEVCALSHQKTTNEVDAPFLSVCRQAFHMYQARNLLICYDAIGTLADRLGNELASPEIIEILLPPLAERCALLLRLGGFG